MIKKKSTTLADGTSHRHVKYFYLAKVGKKSYTGRRKELLSALLSLMREKPPEGLESNGTVLCEAEK